MLPWLTLDALLQWGTSLWVLVPTIVALTIFPSKLFEILDRWAAWYLSPAFDEFQKFPTAKVKTISDEYIRPDKDLLEKYHGKTPKITQLAKIENWLMHYPIDYSFFWDYEIDPKECKEAFSRLLGKIPYVGGVICKIG